MVEADTFYHIPGRAPQDSLYLWLNLIPLGLSALIRALLWSLEIPLAVFKLGWNDMKWEDDFLTVLACNSDLKIDSSKIEIIKSELKRRNAHRIPHAGGRHFTDHIEGIKMI